MKTTLNYLKNLPLRAINYQLTAVEAIIFTVAIMIASAITLYIINPAKFAL